MLPLTGLPWQARRWAGDEAVPARSRLRARACSSGAWWVLADTHREEHPCFHTGRLQFESKPDKPDAVHAHKLHELIGGTCGEMTVTMQYLSQGWNCRMPGKYKDLIMDIVTGEIGHVEMPG
jgi:Manganese containing catalase